MLPYGPTCGSGVLHPICPFASIPIILSVLYGSLIMVLLRFAQNLALSELMARSPGAYAVIIDMSYFGQ